MRFEDDPAQNRLTTIEKYEIPAPWKRLEGGRVEFATKDYFISADLADLSANGPRKRDVHLGRPREATRTVELELPVNWPSDGWNIAVEAPGALFETALIRDRKKKRLFTLTQRLRIERDTMPAADAHRYAELVSAMRKGSDVVIASATSGDAFVKAGGMSRWLDPLRLGVIVIAILAALARFLSRTGAARSTGPRRSG
ncbi:MAG: hypothetical protein FD124_3100 [Alphaproteobacteria bacterium]|nr:MAG: hypothetical protein FD124_3100 [Alphaproteobacteria bacterium]